MIKAINRVLFLVLRAVLGPGLYRLGWLGALLFCAFFLFRCTSPEQRAIRRVGQQRLQDRSPVRTIYRGDIYGEYKRGDYEGPSCEQNLDEDSEDECADQCREMYGKEYRKCEDLPAELVRDLYPFFEQMRHIQNPRKFFRENDIFTFGVMIDVDTAPIKELVDEWSEREASLFLIWVAETIQVAAAIEHHDEDNMVLSEVFEKVGSQYDKINGSTQRIIAGINEDLQGFTNTFWTMAQAQQVRNEAAFIAMHRLVDEVVCDTKLCKEELYCARVAYGRSRLSVVGRCPYQAQGRLPGAGGSDYCYVHGAAVWSFWNILNRSGKIKDKDFDRKYEFNQTKCNTVCGKAADSKCNRDYS